MEHDNLRAALEWSRVDEAGAEAGLRLTGALRWFWARRGHWREGDKWLAAALERGGEVPPSVSSRALLGASHFSWRGGNYALATTLAERGLAQCRQLGDKEGTSAFLNAQGIVALLQGDYQRAITICEETFGLSRELGNKSLMGTQLTHLGIVAGYQADYTRAIRLHEEGLALFRELGDKWNIAFALWTMGRAQFGQGDESGALASLMEGLSLCKDVGDRWVTQGCLEGVARVASARGHYERAARLLGAVETLYENLGYGRSVRVQAAHDRDIAFARTALGDSAFVAAWSDGCALMLGEAIAYALESAVMLQQETPGKDRQAKNASTLTRREQEVARLVARGLTNREIATELVVTERTAETHVQNIFNKLGFTSRAQVATWATEQRLSEVAER